MRLQSVLLSKKEATCSHEEFLGLLADGGGGGGGSSTAAASLTATPRRKRAAAASVAEAAAQERPSEAAEDAVRRERQPRAKVTIDTMIQMTAARPGSSEGVTCEVLKLIWTTFCSYIEQQLLQKRGVVVPGFAHVVLNFIVSDAGLWGQRAVLVPVLSFLPAFVEKYGLESVRQKVPTTRGGVLVLVNYSHVATAAGVSRDVVVNSLKDITRRIGELATRNVRFTVDFGFCKGLFHGRRYVVKWNTLFTTQVGALSDSLNNSCLKAGVWEATQTYSAATTTVSDLTIDPDQITPYRSMYRQHYAWEQGPAGRRRTASRRRCATPPGEPQAAAEAEAAAARRPPSGKRPYFVGRWRRLHGGCGRKGAATAASASAEHRRSAAPGPPAAPRVDDVARRIATRERMRDQLSSAGSASAGRLFEEADAGRRPASADATAELEEAHGWPCGARTPATPCSTRSRGSHSHSHGGGRAYSIIAPVRPSSAGSSRRRTPQSAGLGRSLMRKHALVP